MDVHECADRRPGGSTGNPDLPTSHGVPELGFASLTGSVATSSLRPLMVLLVPRTGLRVRMLAFRSRITASFLDLSQAMGCLMLAFFRNEMGFVATMPDRLQGHSFDLGTDATKDRALCGPLP